MRTLDFLKAQAQLAKAMRDVCESNKPLTINGMGKDEVVMMPLSLYKQLDTSTKSGNKASTTPGLTPSPTPSVTPSPAIKSK